jgi:hypothetical protein
MSKIFSFKTISRSFSIIEIIVVLALVSVIVSFSFPKKQIKQLDLAVDRLILYLQYTRYIAFIDNKFQIDDSEWEKKRWSLKFQRCSKQEDGLYFVVFSDESGRTGAFKKAETMRDPLNNKYLYSEYDCIPSENESKNILLTKEYGVMSVNISCNTTSTIGQISFGNDGKIYSQLGMSIKEIIQPCIITLEDKNKDKREIELIPKSGFIHKL